VKKYLNASGLIALFGIELALFTGYLLLILPGLSANVRAAFLMRLGLIVVWIVCGGLGMLRLREPIRNVCRRFRLDASVQFVLLATFLALVEEMITTTLTNMAPLFGVPLGAAYITASSNYFDVVCFHSVVVFIPMFIGWAVLLRRYAFSPAAVFLLFGISGVLAEALYGGGQALLDMGLWVFVYGLMVYLPAYILPANSAAKPPRWWHYGLAILLPLVFAVPVALVVGAIHPVRVHFGSA